MAHILLVVEGGEVNRAREHHLVGRVLKMIVVMLSICSEMLMELDIAAPY